MQVFFSYAAADRELASDLAAGLKKEGYEVWLADDRLYPGDNWSLAIGRALEESDAMVVLLSPEAARAESVQREIDYALVSLNYKNKVIPVVVRPTRDYPWILDRFPMIRVGRSPSETAKRIAAALRQS
jgi:hypothetical protein